MSTLLNNLQSSLPQIFTALVASAIAFLGLVITKENKTSDFRQAWIDALRQDISDYIAAVRVLAQGHMRFNTQSKTHNEEVEFSQSMQNIYLSSSSSLARIRLRINPNDSDEKLKKLNTSMLNQTKAIQNHLAKGEYRDSLIISNHLHEQASELLKLEWDRVKSGEPIYRLSKTIASAIFILLAILLVFGYVFAK